MKRFRPFFGILFSPRWLVVLALVVVVLAWVVVMTALHSPGLDVLVLLLLLAYRWGKHRRQDGTL
jgi:hypothetical protein